MAVRSGKDGVITVGGNPVGQLVEFNFNASVAEIEKGVKGQAYTPVEAGRKSSSGTVQCLLDNEDTNGQQALEEGSEVALVLNPQGTTAGFPTYTVTALITNREFTSPLDDMCAITFNWRGNSELVEGVAA